MRILRTIAFLLPASAKAFRSPGLQVSPSTSRLSSTATMDEACRYLSSDETGGIRQIASDYDVFLLDMWGVMHDGVRPYEGVLEVVQQLKEANKKLIILSNSSKRKENSVKMLKKLGFPSNTFDEIITSGEVAHHLLLHLSGNSPAEGSWVPQTIPEAFQKLKEKESSELSAVCFGSGDGDEEYLKSCGWKLAESVETADLIVARGTFVVLSGQDSVNKNEDEGAYWSSYQKTLEQASRLPNPPPMVVCNPDKVRPDAAKSPMPGTIGVAYQELLEQANSTQKDLILSLGKPFSSVYEIALASLRGKGESSSRVIMVGDALETDVTGANAAGIDSVWVIQDGIHNEEIATAGASLKDGCEVVLRDFNERSNETYAKGRTLSPTVVLPHFRW